MYDRRDIYRRLGQGGFIDRAEIDDMLPLSAIEMIEVYRSLSGLPGEMADAHARQCGAIGLWTRRGG